MKKLLAAILCAALILFPPAAVSANSGPVRIQASPSFSVAPLSDCPVTVEKEDLSFDFSAQKKNFYSPLAQVTARYEMKDPSPKAQNVQMAFPLLASLSDFSKMKQVRIQADGKDLPFNISVGEAQAGGAVSRAYFTEEGTLNASSLPSFEEILKSVSQPSSTPAVLSGQGTLYRFSCDQNSRLKISLPARGKNTAVLTSGANGFSGGGSGWRLEGQAGPESAMSVLVFGKMSAPAVQACTEDGENQSGAAVRTEESKQDAASFLREKIRQTKVYQAYPTEKFLTVLTGAAVRAAGSAAEAGNPFSDAALYDFLEQKRILVLTYAVSFSAGQTRQVSVQYPMSGAMDARRTASPVYSYGYLLSPARRWAGFRNLSIQILPPKEAPYVVGSSLAMTRLQSGAYSAKLASLPDENLTFSLYRSQRLKPASSWLSSLGGKILVTLGLAAVLLLVLFLYGHAKRRKMK